MDGISRPAGSGVPVTIDGRDVILEAFRLEDFGVVENHMRAKLPNLIEMAAKAASVEGVSESLADKIIDKAFAEARKIHSIPPGEVLEFLNTPEGLALGVWICLERSYPGQFTMSNTFKYIQDLAEKKTVEFNELKRKRDMISGLGDEGNSTGRLDAAASNSATPSQLAEANQPAGTSETGEIVTADAA